MAITTQGHRISVLPQIQYLPPSALTPNLSGIIPAASQGVGLATQIQQIAAAAQERPIRQALQQIALQEAEARLAREPAARQLQQVQIAEAQQNAAVPQAVIENVDVIGGGKELVPVDPTASFENFQIKEDFAPRVRVTSGQNIGAGGVKTPYEKRETLATAAQIESEAAKQAASIEASKALATHRLAGKEFETEALINGYKEALAAGDEGTAGLYKSLIDRKAAMPGILGAGTIYGRKLESMAPGIGLTMNQAEALSTTPAGARVIAKLGEVQAKIKAGRYAVLKLTPEEQAALDAVNSVEAPAVTIPGIARPKTKAERDALPANTQYIGPDGLTYTKR